MRVSECSLVVFVAASAFLVVVSMIYFFDLGWYYSSEAQLVLMNAVLVCGLEFVVLVVVVVVVVVQEKMESMFVAVMSSIHLSPRS